MHLTALTDALDILLEPDRFEDYGPNGLQVEGRGEVQNLVTGVTACQALLEAAVAAGADAVLVHHGLFWRGDDPRVVGMLKRRLATLLAHDLSLLAYHLPLDFPPQLGNNVQLAARLGIEVDGDLAGHGRPAGLVGYLPEPLTGATLATRIAKRLGRPPLHVAAGPAEITTVAWCTGGGQGYIDRAADAGVDAYLTGEVSEPTVHIARERGLHLFACGHHATERYGVQAVGESLAEQFGLVHRFIDIDNPA